MLHLEWADIALLAVCILSPIVGATIGWLVAHVRALEDLVNKGFRSTTFKNWTEDLIVPEIRTLRDLQDLEIAWDNFGIRLAGVRASLEEEKSVKERILSRLPQGKYHKDEPAQARKEVDIEV
jgi:hypothetical protein